MPQSFLPFPFSPFQTSPLCSQMFLLVLLLVLHLVCAHEFRSQFVRVCPPLWVPINLFPSVCHSAPFVHCSFPICFPFPVRFHLPSFSCRIAGLRESTGSGGPLALLHGEVRACEGTLTGGYNHTLAQNSPYQPRPGVWGKGFPRPADRQGNRPSPFPPLPLSPYHPVYVATLSW